MLCAWGFTNWLAVPCSETSSKSVIDEKLALKLKFPYKFERFRIKGFGGNSWTVFRSWALIRVSATTPHVVLVRYGIGMVISA